MNKASYVYQINFYAAIACMLFTLSFNAKAQSGMALNVAPQALRVDYHKFIADTRHGIEFGLGMRFGGSQVAELQWNPAYFMDLTYRYQLIRFENSTLDLGLGYRLPSVHNEGYYSYGGIWLPISYTHYFWDDSAGLRLRLSPYVGSDPEGFIPSLGFVYLF
jgi:hypothetical protein